MRVVLQRHTVTFSGHLSLMCAGGGVSSQGLTHCARKTRIPPVSPDLQVPPPWCFRGHQRERGPMESSPDVFRIITKEGLPLFAVLWIWLSTQQRCWKYFAVWEWMLSFTPVHAGWISALVPHIVSQGQDGRQRRECLTAWNHTCRYSYTHTHTHRSLSYPNFCTSKNLKSILGLTCSKDTFYLLLAHPSITTPLDTWAGDKE